MYDQSGSSKPLHNPFLLELLRSWSYKNLRWQILDRNKTLLATI